MHYSPTTSISTTTATHASSRIPQPRRSIHPQFKSKPVYLLSCKHCTTPLCQRGMKAILLADTKVELYSTDHPPENVQLVYDDYTTRNCRCKIKDAACLGCGNVTGYHVTQPCEGCLDACNNGHFWMFHTDGVATRERMREGKVVVWAYLPPVEKDLGELKECR